MVGKNTFHFSIHLCVAWDQFSIFPVEGDILRKLNKTLRNKGEELNFLKPASLGNDLLGIIKTYPMTQERVNCRRNKVSVQPSNSIACNKRSTGLWSRPPNSSVIGWSPLVHLSPPCYITPRTQSGTQEFQILVEGKAVYF